MPREFRANPEQEDAKELAQVPAIEIDKTSGHMLPSIIQQRLKSNNEINLQLSEKMQQASRGLDDESQRWLSLILDHPDWAAKIFLQLQQHKDVHQEQAEQYVGALQAVRSEHPQWKQQTPDNRLSEEKREQAASQLEKTIANIHSNLGIQLDEAPENIVLIQPSEGKESGWGLSMNNIVVISSHPENPDNAQHEYMHSFVNKWVISLGLDEKEQTYIRKNVPQQLREAYGDDAHSLLSELIIRTYLYGPPREKQTSVLADRLDKLINDYKQQSNKQQSFGTFLKERSELLFD